MNLLTHFAELTEISCVGTTNSVFYPRESKLRVKLRVCGTSFLKGVLDDYSFRILWDNTKKDVFETFLEMVKYQGSRWSKSSWFFRLNCVIHFVLHGQRCSTTQPQSKINTLAFYQFPQFLIKKVANLLEASIDKNHGNLGLGKTTKTKRIIWIKQHQPPQP